MLLTATSLVIFRNIVRNISRQKRKGKWQRKGIQGQEETVG